MSKRATDDLFRHQQATSLALQAHGTDRMFQGTMQMLLQSMRGATRLLRMHHQCFPLTCIWMV
jgi:hypothetical protein